MNRLASRQKSRHNGGMYISINSHVVRSNTKHGRDDPPIRIARTRSDRSPTYAREIRIDGPSRLVYDPNRAILNCGARLVLVADRVEVVR